MQQFEDDKVTLDAGCAERSCACYSPQFGDTGGVPHYPESIVTKLLDRIAELEKENSSLKYEISSGAWQPKEATDQELFNVYAHLQDTYEGDNFPVALGRTILKLYTTPQDQADRIAELEKECAWAKDQWNKDRICFESRKNELEKDLALKTRDRNVFRNFTLAYEERIEELEKQIQIIMQANKDSRP